MIGQQKADRLRGLLFVSFLVGLEAKQQPAHVKREQVRTLRFRLRNDGVKPSSKFAAEGACDRSLSLGSSLVWNLICLSHPQSPPTLPTLRVCHLASPSGNPPFHRCTFSVFLNLSLQLERKWSSYNQQLKIIKIVVYGHVWIALL